MYVNVFVYISLCVSELSLLASTKNITALPFPQNGTTLHRTFPPLPFPPPIVTNPFSFPFLPPKQDTFNVNFRKDVTLSGHKVTLGYMVATQTDFHQAPVCKRSCVSFTAENIKDNNGTFFRVVKFMYGRLYTLCALFTKIVFFVF